MATLSAHQKRIKKELAAAGMTSYGQHKLSSRYLPNLIAEDEHIKGVVYGHRAGGLAMLVATDQRVIYLEKRPFFTSSDDISYEVVAGTKFMDAGIFPSATLHTRMGDYTLTYVNPKCARIFIDYIDTRIARLDIGEEFSHAKEAPPDMPKAKMSSDAREFLRSCDVGVLSTTDRTGHVRGATIYYFLGEDGLIYFLTKSDTAKAQNMVANNQVALTVFDPVELKTAQIHGYTSLETDFVAKRYIFDELVKPRNYGGEVLPPPVTQLSRGGFVAFKITPTFVKYTDFRHKDSMEPSS